MTRGVELDIAPALASTNLPLFIPTTINTEIVGLCVVHEVEVGRVGSKSA
jgi:hypothetical protein